MKKGCTSSDVFGNELHRYTIGDGIRDKNVLAFDPYMVATFRDTDIKSKIALEKVHAAGEAEAIADPQKSEEYYRILDAMPMAGYYEESGKYIRGAEDSLPASQYQTEKHMNAVIDDILRKYNHISHNHKFHSIFATSSIPEAIAYYRRLKVKAPTLNMTLLVDPSDNNDETGYDKMAGLAEVIADYRQKFGMTYTLSTYAEMKKDISLRLSHDKAYKGIEKTPEKQIDMLIVVNQMLTGFDSKWINVLYLDKLMRQENIIQAFSRTNRIYGSDKPVGQIYYYRYPHTMRRNIEEAVRLYSGDKAFMVFVDKLEKNLGKLNAVYTEIKELFDNEGMEDFSHLPKEIAVRAKFALKFRELSDLLEMVKVQDFTWKINVYGDTTVLITENMYYILLQRYKELFRPTEPGSSEEPPYDLDPHITEISTGKIDADYMNSRFEKYYKLKIDAESKESAEKALQELYKSFAMLPEEEQRFAELFIHDVQMGNVLPEAGKTFRDYITEYIRRDREDAIHRFARTFGLNEPMLRELAELHVTKENINEYGRFDNLKATADPGKILSYFTKTGGKPISAFKARVLFANLLDSALLNSRFHL